MRVVSDMFTLKELVNQYHELESRMKLMIKTMKNYGQECDYDNCETITLYDYCDDFEVPTQYCEVVAIII